LFVDVIQGQGLAIRFYRCFTWFKSQPLIVKEDVYSVYLCLTLLYLYLFQAVCFLTFLTCHIAIAFLILLQWLSWRKGLQAFVEKPVENPVFCSHK
jgi:hypothetical protein